MITKRVITGVTLSLVAITILTAQSQTSFQISNVGSSAYTIDGVSNPTLTLYRGVTYTFQVSTPGHPFWIKTTPTTGTGNPYTSGVSGNGNAMGNVVFAVPMDAPDELHYICEFHSSMTGVFQIETAPLAVENGPAYPAGSALLSNYPNPFNPATTIRFELPRTADVQIVIFDLLGMEITRLVEQSLNPGIHHVVWDGRDQMGQNVPSGIYVARMTTPGYAQSIRLVLLK